VQVLVGHPPIRRIHTTSYWVVLRIVFLRDTMTIYGMHNMIDLDHMHSADFPNNHCMKSRLVTTAVLLESIIISLLRRYTAYE